MSLSTQQLLLLNNMMYLEPEEGPFPDPDAYTGRYVKDWIRSIDMDQWRDPDPDVPLMTTKKEWTDILAAIRNDRYLMDMKILAMYTDISEEGGGCRSAIFLGRRTRDAVLVFRGTDIIAGSLQWKDNFISGNTADSPHQIRALEWYRECYRKYRLRRYEITVTGHSKGGNKAKYITILDDSVDHCVSFNGEGFSDQFFDKYSEQIAKRYDRIRNHIVDYDYISPLMNDIGRVIVYYGNNYGSGGFTENHLANTFMRFEEDGNFYMDVREDGRPAEMMALDEFTNSYMRSMTEEERGSMLSSMNALLDAVLSIRRTMTSNEIAQIFLEMAESDEHCRNFARLFAYVILYEQKYPRMKDLLNSVLVKFDLGGISQYVDLVAGTVNWHRQVLWISLDFRKIASTVTAIGKRLPEWVYARVAAYIEKSGITLSMEQIRKLEETIIMTDSYLKTLTVCEDSTDRHVWTQG